VDALDRLYVADAENNRIVVFNSDGSYHSHSARMDQQMISLIRRRM